MYMRVCSSGAMSDKSREERAAIRKAALEWTADVDVAANGGARDGRRVIIAKIVYENFKSYAGVQEVGPFHKNFSAVVGPNGSGKSNVIDGLLFVSGKRAKSLRQSKVSDLIHTSAEHPDLEHARVDVHFVEIHDDGTDTGGDADPETYRVIEGTELIVSRTAHRNNTSKYYVNGRATIFADVSKLLKRCGIDLDHNRFLILQGEVEQISMMKPKGQTVQEEGLLEYLEDIIGSHRFVEPIESAADELEVLNEERAEKLNRVRFVEKEKDSLERAKNEAESYIATDVQLRQQRGRLHQIYRRDAQRQADKAEAGRAAIVEELEAERAKLSGHDAEIRAAEDAVAEARAAHDTVQGELDEAKAEFSAYEARDVRHREDMKHLKDRERKAVAALARERKKLAEAETAQRDAAEEVGKLTSKVAEEEKRLSAEEAKLAEILESLKGETAPLRDALEAKQAELVPLRGAADAAAAALDVAASERDMLAAELAETEGAVAAAEAAVAECEASVAATREELAAVTTEASDADAADAANRKKLEQLTREEAELAQRVRRARAAVEVARSAATDVTARDRVLDALDAARDSGKIKGACGRLGDLGTIDKKYDVAVSTACPALNHYVVETVQAAQQCVALLRDGGLGRATFVILERLGHLVKGAGSSLETPDAVPRLFDLVERAEAKYDTAFYFAMRDTLVAENLDAATRIAVGGKRRWRVVTLTGEVVDASGTMAGGGKRVARGLLGPRNGAVVAKNAKQGGSAASLAEQASALDRDTEALTRTRGEISTLTETLREHKRGAVSRETRGKKLTMRLASLEAALPGLRESLESTRASTLSTDVGPLKKRLAAAEKQVVPLAAAAEKAAALAADAAAVVAGVEARVVAAGGGRMRTQSLLVTEIRSSLDDIRKRIRAAGVAASGAAKRAERASGEAERIDADIADIRTRAGETRAQFEELTKEATSVMERYRAIETRGAEATEQVAAAVKAAENLNAATAGLRRREAALEASLEDVARAVAEAVGKVKYWTAKLEEEREGIEKAIELPGGHTAIGIFARGAGKGTGKDGKDGKDGSGEDDSDDDSDGADEQQQQQQGAKHHQRPSIPELTEDDLLELAREDVQYEITRLEGLLAGAEPNMSAIVLYREREEEWRSRVADLDTITDMRDAQRREYEALRKRRLDSFMGGFSQITLRLKELYQMITLGGDAELELVDSLDPFSEGVVFSVRPPKKSWKNISNLSGGEKTLSSLALIFALHSYAPSPVFFLDEIDAALDFKNVSIVASYIASKRNAQFIVISLRSQSFELADRLVGIYKTHNATKSVAINPRAFVVPPALRAAAAAAAAAANGTNKGQAPLQVN
jgi:structural maintenance of chromosome 4